MIRSNAGTIVEDDLVDTLRHDHAQGDDAQSTCDSILHRASRRSSTVRPSTLCRNAGQLEAAGTSLSSSASGLGHIQGRSADRMITPKAHGLQMGRYWPEVRLDPRRALAPRRRVCARPGLHIKVRLGKTQELTPMAEPNGAEHFRAAGARSDGIRRRRGRGRPGGPRGRDPAEAALARPFRRGAREGLRGRRPHPVRRRDRSGRARQARARVAAGWRPPADHRGHGRPVLLPRPGRRRAAAQCSDAQADEQPRQFRRLAGQCGALSRPQGRGARGRDLSRASRPSRCCTASTGEVVGVASGDMGVGTRRPRSPTPTRAAWSCGPNTCWWPRGRAARWPRA